MRLVHHDPVAGLVAVVVLLGSLAVTVGLDPRAWVVGLACGGLVAAGTAHGMARHGRLRLGPADRVTAVRGVLTCGVAALVTRPSGAVVALVLLASVALVLDAVDGWVARRTGPSAFGAGFDMEVDAFLVLVLSVYVAASTGPWVLAIGLARYALAAAARLVPWLARPTPPRYWAKVVAAVQGVVLTVAAAGVLPATVTTLALVVALGLLVESFAHQVGQLWRHRLDDVPRPAVDVESRVAA